MHRLLQFDTLRYTSFDSFTARIHEDREAAGSMEELTNFNVRTIHAHINRVLTDMQSPLSAQRGSFNQLKEGQRDFETMFDKELRLIYDVRAL